MPVPINYLSTTVLENTTKSSRRLAEMELNGIMNEGQNSEAVLSPHSTSSTNILSKALQKNKNSR
ncbi:hypothetical protein OUZ56_008519 [Daphnia magna]|uniref:Uncharacterized protein n=1 Tax=Daphnia magna TaxID=35525 RepID=A0ABR0AD83_9CRUS|nr:hypothetical protein OUZ56_008519 [Daphnia magna]